MLDEFIMLISVLQVVEMEYRDHGERWSKKQKANLTHFSTVSCLDEFCLQNYSTGPPEWRQSPPLTLAG